MGDVNLEIKLSNLDERVIKYDYSFYIYNFIIFIFSFSFLFKSMYLNGFMDKIIY